jgi:hypothetical protein
MLEKEIGLFYFSNPNAAKIDVITSNMDVVVITITT